MAHNNHGVSDLLNHEEVRSGYDQSDLIGTGIFTKGLGAWSVCDHQGQCSRSDKELILMVTFRIVRTIINHHRINHSCKDWNQNVSLFVTLFQGDDPVTYTLIILTPNGECYADNEKELPTAVLSTECSRQNF